MIVSTRQAQEAWDVLRQWARIIDERWDLGPLRVEGRTKAEVAEIYRAACKHSHPDMGGRLEDFAKVDRAKHVLLAWLERQADAPPPAHGGASQCPRCNGACHVLLYKGLRQMRVQCPTCQGNGEIYDERKPEGDRM